QLRDSRGLAESQHALGGSRSEQMHPSSDNSGPPGLMARPKTGSVVAVEVFIEQEKIPPMQIVLKLPRTPLNWPPPVFISEKSAMHAGETLFGDLVQGNMCAGAGRTFHFEFIPIIGVIL